MKGKLLTISLLSLCLTTFSCGNITIHDTKICTVSGVLSAGTSCVNAVSGIKTNQTFEELIESLEPTQERAGAVIIPMNDFIDLKTSLEQACVYVRCSKKKLNMIIKNIEGLINAN